MYIYEVIILGVVAICCYKWMTSTDRLIDRNHTEIVKLMIRIEKLEKRKE